MSGIRQGHARLTPPRRSHRPFPPWMATASTPLSSRYSWIASTSAFFSAKISTCHNTGILEKATCACWQRAQCPEKPVPSRTEAAAAPGQPECVTHGWRSLLQALEEVHHLGLLLHVLHFLRRSKKMGQAGSREINPVAGRERCRRPQKPCWVPHGELPSTSPAQRPGWRHLLALR